MQTPDDPAHRWPSRPGWLGRDLALLIAARGLRSVALAYLIILVPIHLALLGFGPVQVGELLTASAVGSAVLTAVAGLASDRIGRRLVLATVGLLIAAGALAYALFGTFVPLLVASAVTGVGRGGGAGGGGAFGPSFPAELALVSEHAGDRDRTAAFGAMSFVGVITASAGCALAGVPALLRRVAHVPLVRGDRMLFAATAIVGLAVAGLVLPVRESPRRRAPSGLGLSRATWRLVGRFFLANGVNGLAIGFLGPVLVYWLHVRYGTSAAAAGGLYLVANLVSAPSQLGAVRLARRLGAVRAILVARVLASLFLAVLPFAPTFLVFGAIFLARTVVNTLAVPVRQSYLMGVIPPAERGTAAGLSYLPPQVAATAGPAIAGYLITETWIGLPLELAAVLQGIGAALYFLLFRHIVPPEERERSG